MKLTFIIAAFVAASTASAYQCADNASVNQACRNISVFPLICNNPSISVEQCNAKQCNQGYINDYASCQCRRNRTEFYQNAVNVEGLIRRCNMTGLTNPYGNPYQYRPGQGTQTFSPSSPAATTGGGSRTAAPITDPSQTAVPITTTSHHISGGAVAGIVLGILGATALAVLLGICWRKNRNQHTAVYNTHAGYDTRGPTRTVVTEKIEPVVVKSVPGAAGTGAAGTSSTTYTTPGAGGTTSTVPGTTTGYNTTTTPTTDFTGTNTATGGTTGTTTTTTPVYNAQPRTGGAVDNSIH
ncbi:hypothetical protein BGX28_000263 [Mortierella sp. GBA30]|nr:hypothetical protein BGX28_000263 [Mortierella sp. GBA30]